MGTRSASRLGSVERNRPKFDAAFVDIFYGYAKEDPDLEPEDDLEDDLEDDDWEESDWDEDDDWS